MGYIKKFFKNAFHDMKESAKEQHKVDVANFRAAKAEATANFAEIKANSSIDTAKTKRRKEQAEQLAAAEERINNAEQRLRQANQRSKEV